LTTQTLLGIPSNVFADPGPAKFAGNQLNSGFDTGMGDSMEGGDG
jgi:hypothetical protein